MGRFPVLSGAEAVRIFEKTGWMVDRQRGSQSSSSRMATSRLSPFPITRNWHEGRSAASFVPRA